MPFKWLLIQRTGEFQDGEELVNYYMLNTLEGFFGTPTGTAKVSEIAGLIDQLEINPEPEP